MRRLAARPPSVFRALLFAVVLAATTAIVGCKPRYAIGDHVWVEWEGADYPASIIEAPGPSKFKVRYDGYDVVWDEVVSKDRIKKFVEGPVLAPEPPAKVRAKAIKAAQSNMYKMGERVRVEWHGQIYAAQITGIVGQEKYRVNYDGYGHEWDEIVGLSRIQPK
jgi:hypothetical protein